MARSFNGTSDYIAADAAHITNAGVEFSIAFWVNAALVNGQELYGEGNSGAAGPFFQIQCNSTGRIVISVRSGTGGASDQGTTSAVVFNSVWRHVCVTQNAANGLGIYIDGSLDKGFGRTALSNAAGQTFNTATWGALRRNTTAGFYGGLLAHGATWSRVLSAQEVAALANGQLPPALGPAHYWPLWGVDSPEPDLVSAGTDGTLTGTSQAAGGPPVGLSLLEIAA